MLQLREDIVAVRTAADHLEEKLKAEILFLKEQLQAEQCFKENLEDTLQMEIEGYKEEKGEAPLPIPEAWHKDRSEKGEKNHGCIFGIHEKLLSCAIIVMLINQDIYWFMCQIYQKFNFDLYLLGRCNGYLWLWVEMSGHPMRKL